MTGCIHLKSIASTLQIFIISVGYFCLSTAPGTYLEFEFFLYLHTLPFSLFLFTLFLFMRKEEKYRMDNPTSVFKLCFFINTSLLGNDTNVDVKNLIFVKSTA